MAVKYLAGKRLKVGDSFREVGDEVPEAASWPTLRAYISMGHIVVEPLSAPEVLSSGSTTMDPEYTARGQELDGMKKDELKEIAKDLEVPVYGSKGDIIGRILSAEFD